jgi:hypothetical protein
MATRPAEACRHPPASTDAKNYLRSYGTSDEIKEGYLAICPFYMARSSLLPGELTGIPVGLVTIPTGHLVGQWEAAEVPDGLPPINSAERARTERADK